MRRVRLAGLAVLGLLAVLPAGCSRSYWRRNADSEAYGLIREKTKLDARWTPPRSDVIPSPLSRLYDPADPDYGALPPDDPAAHRYMHRMSDCDRIRGSHYWDEIGMGHTVENPAWVASLPADGAGPPAVADASPAGGSAASDSEPLPFVERWAITESLRSVSLPSIFRKESPTGRATIATADSPPAGTPAVPLRAAAPAAPAAPPKSAAVAPAVATAKKAETQRSEAPAEAVATAASREPRPDAKPKSDIRLTAFQEEPAAPDGEPESFAEPETPDALPPAPLPPDDDPERVPSLRDRRPPSGEAPDPRGELSEAPGSPETAPEASEGADLTQGNPALPAVENLTLDEAIRLSYLHGREYQTEIEDVFLAALDLAFDRFQFDVRFLGLAGRPSSDLAYSGTPDGPQSLTATNRIGISRLLPAGGQWVVELANQTLWLFSDAPNESGTASTLTFSFVQPLLFAAGRKVVLEDLTQSERNLLYAARDLARFRQIFFVNVVTGGASGGYLGLLQTIQTIANQEDNIQRLQEQLTIAEENILTGDALSRTQLESQLLQQLNQLRSSRAQLQNQLDQFKIQLGLPPDLEMSVDTTFLRPFQLISPELSELELRVDDDYFAVAATLSPDDPDPAGLRRAIETLIPILDEIESVAFPQVEQDLARVRENLPKRLAAAPDPVNDPPRIREYLERDEEQLTEIRNGYVEQVVRVEQLLAAVAAATTPTELQALYVEAGETEEEIERIVRGLQGIQVGLRTELIELNPFEMPLTEAVGYALTNRVDLMNQRALVTDARRKVEVAANALRAVLDLRVEEELSTRPIFNNDNPLDFRRDQSTFRAGVRFVAPLDQIAQRNAYRVSQINYQRVRRSYMQAEDQVKFQVRQAWRDLEVLKRNFEVARNAIRINAQQYDLAVERATGPARGFGGGGGGGAGGGGGGGSSGADQQGLNLINALQRLLQSQNQLIAIWVDYESARLNIYRDMGIMEIDARGVWCDPFYLNGLSLPDGDVQGPPGWVNPAEGTDGPAERNGGPAVIPPAPSPPGGVETEGDGPSGSAPASNPASRPVSRGVLPASHTAPPSPPSRKAGHDRTRQPPVPNRRERPSDRDRAGAAKPEPTRWRSAGQGPGKG